MYLNLSPSTTALPPSPSPVLPSHLATQRVACAGICCGSHVHGLVRESVSVCVYIKIYANAKVCAYG